MAENETEGGAPEGAASQDQSHGAPAGGFVIHTQYVKDLSVENPNAPAVFGMMTSSPQVNVNVDVKANRLREHNYEVVMVATVNATLEEKSAFIIELQYGSYVSVAEDLADKALEEALLIDVPRHLFPFARNIIAAATRDAGFPPLLINSIDFKGMYARQKSAATAEGAAGES